MSAPNQNGPLDESPYEQLASRFAFDEQKPILLIGEDRSVSDLCRTPLAHEMTVSRSIDDQNHPAGSFGGILALGMLEGYSKSRAYEALADAYRLLRDGGVLAATVRYGTIHEERPTHGSNAWNVSGLIDVITKTGFEVDDLRVDQHDSAAPYLVMSVLARKDSA